MKIKNKKNTVRNVTILVASIAILLGSITAWAYLNNIGPFSDESDLSSTDRGVNEVNYGPPSEADLKDSQSAKERLIKEEGKQTTTPSSSNENTAEKEKVSVGIANIYKAEKNLEIRAFIPGTIEGDGTCTAILTKNGLIVSAESKAFIDASTSQCNPIIIPLSKFKESGVWDLVVNYESSKHSGTSTRMETKI